MTKNLTDLDPTGGVYTGDRSSVINWVGYSAQQPIRNWLSRSSNPVGNIYMQFKNGDVYSHSGTPKDVERFLTAKSLGEYFNIHLYGGNFIANLPVAQRTAPPQVKTATVVDVRQAKIDALKVKAQPDVFRADSFEGFSSSLIEQAGYDADSRIMFVEFTDSTSDARAYHEVSPLEWDSFKASASKGRWAHQNLFKNKPSTKLGVNEIYFETPKAPSNYTNVSTLPYRPAAPIEGLVKSPAGDIPQIARIPAGNFKGNSVVTIKRGDGSLYDYEMKGVADLKTAIGEIEKISNALGVPLGIKKVVTTFE